ncbi:MAG: hypothetical protein ACOWWR_07880 [Eubacteriales bacterium]
MKRIFVICIVLISFNAYSQNDTIYLRSDYLILKGDTLNKINSQKERIGKWIKYEINDYYGFSELASGFDNETGMDCHWHTYGNYVYRALKAGEKEESRIIRKEEIDTIKGSIFHDLKVDLIRSKIAPEDYSIISEGKYRNNKKHGTWKYYTKTGKNSKTIKYQNGLPIESFNIYRNDGSLMISAEKQKDSLWIVAKHSKEGKRFDIKKDSIKNFPLLY